ncbi:origin recognition complex subunit 3 isoform X1 [Octopus sinensis]|uniref:Origin recognition complex subunit 3 n=2 Tax=Octopus sinensis TaxID=2607531 RepID=A0A6P7U4C0_9MOLL|nr:origin recognition complex subunit 3 isoform X1 [Octopus sinensis]
MATSSISKGCFAFKGNKKRLNANEILKCNRNAIVNLIYESHTNSWNQINQKFQDLQFHMTEDLFNSLLKYIKSCNTNFSLSNNTGAASRQTRTQEIPTAVLFTGVNTPDHTVMFSNLRTNLQQKISPLVASLTSKTCTTIRNIIQQVLGQIIHQSSQMSFSDDEEDLNPKSAPCTLNTLADWYYDKYKKVGNFPSPAKKKRSENEDTVNADSSPNLPNIVIIFEDLESFTLKPLQDFIMICSSYQCRLPMVFIFGVATTMNSVHNSLPKLVSSQLCMEKFQVPPPSEYMTRLLDETLLNADVPFKLGPKVFEYLLDVFLYHNFSISYFMKGIKIAILDHFFSCSLSYLILPEKNSEVMTQHIKQTDPDAVRQLPSFMKYVEISPHSKQKSLLLSDKALKEELAKLLEDFHLYHKNFFIMLNCLHILVGKLPKYPLGKQRRELYLLCLKQFICDTEQYQEAMNLLRFLSKDELENMLISCQESLLKQTLTDPCIPVCSKLCDFLKMLEDLDGMKLEEENKGNSDDEELAQLPKRTNLHNLRKTLQEMDKKKKKLSPFEKLREEIISYMDSNFRIFLKCPSSIPLHEVFYYDSLPILQDYFTVCPRAAIQKALSQPHSYLKCSCCEADPGVILSSFPDVCVAYKLHLECGRLINLYDWLQSFITVLEDSENKPKRKDQHKVLQARFIQAISELQFLGFIKPTRQKTDHVARLTWGGC